MSESVGALLSAILSSALVTSLLAAVFGWMGKRYLDKSLEAERAEHEKHLASMQAQHAKELERVRAAARLSESYFTRQLEASGKIYEIIQDWLPSLRHPDMDWHEALTEMGDGVGAVGKKATAICTMYYPVLPEPVIALLTHASSLSEELTFAIPERVGSPSYTNEVEEVYNRLRKAAAHLKEAVDGQAHALTPSALELQTRDTEGPGIS